MLVRMKVSRIVIVDSEEDPVAMIVLREVEGAKREFPILIGIFEAYAIDRRTKGMPVPRPLTHDLIENILGQLDCIIEQIVIHELKDSTFYAKLVVRSNGELIEIDSRPSDALAVGAGTEVPIYVDESVLKEVC